MNDLITIYAGSEKQKFSIHAHMLRQIPWFRTCLDAGMRETQESTISLPEDNAVFISHLLHWTHYHKFQFDLPELARSAALFDDYNMYREMFATYNEASEIVVGVYLLGKKC